jgi:hypothetical protein
MLNMAVHKATIRLCVVKIGSDTANNLLMNVFSVELLIELVKYFFRKEEEDEGIKKDRKERLTYSMVQSPS